jgi:hypothetical protein
MEAGVRLEQDPRIIREQLQRILVSPGFLHSERLRRFLTHCIESTLSGQVQDLKEYAIGVVVFDRPKLYNPADDPIVRVEARRLRKKLEEYYQGRGAVDPLVIQVPKGGYLPSFETRRKSLKPPARLLWVVALCCTAQAYGGSGSAGAPSRRRNSR